MIHSNLKYCYPLKWNLKIRLIIPILIGIFFLTSGCKSTRKSIKEPIKEYGADYIFQKLKENEFKFNGLSTRFNLDLVINSKKNSFGGQLRMTRDSAIWISLSPALGIEIGRVLITQDSVKYINRINKTYFIGNWEQANQLLGTNIDFDVLQSLLIGNDLTYYEEGKFRISYDSKEYHLVTAGRSKLKKYVVTREDSERIYIQNIFLSPETFKITSMKIKELTRDNKKLDALYSDFEQVDGQLFPSKVVYNLTSETEVKVDLNYSKISMDGNQSYPFKVTDKYTSVK